MGDPAGVDDRERAYFESILELKGLPLLDENARLSWHESRRAFMKSAMSECTEKQFREQWSDGYVVRSSLYLLNHGVLFRFGY
jgi:hypothetical protein